MALRFNGTNSVVAYTTSGTLPNFNAFTMLCVGKISVDRNSYSTFFTIGDSNAADNATALVQTEPDGLTIVAYDYTGNLIAVGPTLVVGAYYGIALSSNGGGTTADGVKLYVKRLDSDVATSAVSGKFGSGYYSGAIGCVRFGDTHYGEPLNGTVENAQLFNRVLSQSEIENAWMTRVPAGNPIRWWPMIGGSTSASLYDLAGQSALSTSGSPTVEDGAPIPWGSAVVLNHRSGSLKSVGVDISESASHVVVGKRGRKIAFGSEITLTPSATPIATRGLMANIVVHEAHPTVIKRSRKVAPVVVVKEIMTPRVKRTRPISPSFVESIAHIFRAGKKKPLAVAFSEHVNHVVAGSRTRRVVPGIVESETNSAVLRRVRKVNGATIAESRAQITAIKRKRNVIASVAENEILTVLPPRRTRRAVVPVSTVITHSSIPVKRNRKAGPKIVETIEANGTTPKRSRRITPSVSESINLTSRIRASRVASAGINQVEAFAVAAGVRKYLRTVIAEGVSVSSTLRALKIAAFDIAIAFDYQFGRLKKLEVSIDEHQTHTFGAMRRTRTAVSEILEVLGHAISLKKASKVSLNIAQLESVAVALVTARSMAVTLSELLTNTTALSRSRDIQLTIAEVEALAIRLGTIFDLSFAVAMSESIVGIDSDRQRGVALAIEEELQTALAIVRALAIGVVIHQEDIYQINAGRLRDVVSLIIEEEGFEVLSDRTRGLFADIEIATGIACTLNTDRGQRMRVILSWKRWVGDDEGGVRMQTFTDDIIIPKSAKMKLKF